MVSLLSFFVRARMARCCSLDFVGRIVVIRLIAASPFLLRFKLARVSRSAFASDHQVGDPITLDSVDLAWRERMPLLDDGAVLSWIYVYPKVGRLASLPEAPSPEEASFILYYGAYAAAGAVYHGPASCGDAVACLIVISATEGDAEADIRRAYEWFEERTVWTPLGDDEAGGDAVSH